MFSFIGTVFKYSGLVLSILVLSHIVQIKGISISQYVDIGISWVSGVNPSAPFNSFNKVAHRITDQMSEQISARNKIIEKSLNEETITQSDQRQLNSILKKK